MIQENSRYVKFIKATQLRNYNFIELLKLTGYRVHVCKQGDKIEALSERYLNDTSKYWVILACNQILDPFLELEVGQKLAIPKKAILDEINK